MAFDGKQIRNATIVGAKLANLTITDTQLAADAVTTAKILNAAVDATKLAANSVVEAKITDSAVTTAKIADANVTGAKLAANAVDASKLADGSVTLAKLAADSVDSSKIKDGSITGTDISSNTVAASNLVTAYETGLLFRDGTRAMSGALDLGSSNRIINLGNPTQAQDAATKAYVDSVVTSLDLKASVRAATTADIALSSTTSSVDGVALGPNDRVLAKDQSTASENGIWVVSASGPWARASDANTSAQVSTGLFTFVEEGVANGSTGWVLTTSSAITVGTTPLSFTQFSGAGAYLAGFGLTLSGNSFAVDFNDSDATVSEVNATQDAGVSNKVARADHSHELADGAVTTDKLADGAVTLDKVDQVSLFTPFSEFVQTSFLRLNGSNGPLTGDLDAGDHTVSNVANIEWGAAGDNQDAVNYRSMFFRLQALALKEPVLVATTENIALDGSVLDIDGVTLGNTNRVLVKDQTDASENGIYWALPSQPWQRALDFEADGVNDGGSDVRRRARLGATVAVIAGDANASTTWILSSSSAGPDPDLNFPQVGTDELHFTSLTVDIAFGAIEDLAIGGASNDGAATTAARSDHIHALPNLATGSTAGFLSAADKTSIDAWTAGNDNDILAGATGDIAVNSQKIVDLDDPTDLQDAATKAYVDSRVAGAVTGGDITNKSMVAKVTTTDGSEACATGMAHDAKGYVQVFVNGLKALLMGDKTGECYFSADSGSTAKALGSIVSADKLYWNGSIAEYQLAVSDRVSFDYIY